MSTFGNVTTISVLLLLIGIYALLIWSYGEIEQYTKMIIFIPELYTKMLNKIDINYTEFSFTIYSQIHDLWVSGAWPDAVVLFISQFIWPFVKLLFYLTLLFIPLPKYYQYKILRHINSYHRMMFFLLYTMSIQAATFTFDIVIPVISDKYDIQTSAQSYPEKGIVIHTIFALLLFAMDYVFYLLVYFKVDNNTSVTKMKPRKYVDNTAVIRGKSYAAIVWYAFIIVLNVANLWICIESLYSAPVRFEVKGVIGYFVPDYIATNNVLQMGNLITSSSLVNVNYGNFLLCVFFIITIIIPIVFNVLLIIFWLLPLIVDTDLFNNLRYNNENIYTNFLAILWGVGAWNGLVALLICLCGVGYTEVSSKYLVDGLLPQYCGEGSVVDNIFGTDCCFSTADYVNGMLLITITLAITHFSLYYAEYVFGYKYEKVTNKISIQN